MLRSRMRTTEKLELRATALRALYDAYGASLRQLSDRSFTTTLQALTLNGAVLAALIASKLELLPMARLLGSVSVLGFSLLVCVYLISKGRAYLRLRATFALVETAMHRQADADLPVSSTRVQPVRRFLGGSRLFCFAVLGSALATSLAFWFPLAQPE